MSYYVYMIVTKIKDKTISYVGYTSNLSNRLSLHNTSKGAKFTKGKKWELIYHKKFLSKNLAMKYEYELKNNINLRKKIKEQNIK